MGAQGGGSQTEGSVFNADRTDHVLQAQDTGESHPISQVDLNTIVEKLAEHYRPDTEENAERFKFFKRQQNDKEGVIDYMAELHKLTKTCNFSSYLDMALHN